MTKQFCDICGHIAADNLPTTRFPIPAMAWNGCRSTKGSISPTDGNWTPYVQARAVFEGFQFKGLSDDFRPDLCVECQAKILQQMATEIMKGRNG